VRALRPAPRKALAPPALRLWPGRTGHLRQLQHHTFFRSPGRGATGNARNGAIWISHGMKLDCPAGMETISEPDIEPAARAAAAVFAYHRRTAHRADGYARGPEALDWDAQPDPWRTWRGCDRLDLPLVS